MISPSPALDLRRVEVRSGRHVLAGADALRIEPGERVALIGPSGCGKSTLARAITGSLPATLSWSGRIAVGGASLCARGRRPSPAALVQQDTQTALHPLVPVGRQMALPWRGRPRQEARAATRDLAARVGLDVDLLDRLPGELSGGQRQRACLAIALAARTPLLVADEPTSALDPITARRVLDTIVAMPVALLLITHDPAVAAHVADRTISLPDLATPTPGQVA